MQHCRTWQSSSCNVTIHEIDGAEHRAILANAQFHSILLNYLINEQYDTTIQANDSFQSSTIVHNVAAISSEIRDDSNGFVAIDMDEVQDDSFIVDNSTASTTSVLYNSRDIYSSIDQHDISLQSIDNEDDMDNIKDEAQNFLKSITIQKERFRNGFDCAPTGHQVTIRKINLC